MKPINTDIKYILAYGPSKAMTPGYEKECDDIADNDSSKCMRFIILYAFIIRKDRNILFKEARDIHSKIVMDCEKEFNVNDPLQLKMKEKIYSILKLWLNKKIEPLNESFVTSAAPIVPYKNLMFKQDNFINDLTIDKDPNLILKNHLIEHIGYILQYSNYSIIDAMNSDYSKISSMNLPIEVLNYYKLAYLNYHNMINNVIDLRNITYKLENKFSDDNSFNTMIQSMITNTDISNSIYNIDYQYAIESLEDPTMDKRCNIAINKILNSNKIYKEEEYKAAYKIKYELQSLLNETAKRYMKFDEYADMFFTSNIDSTHIVNINHFDKNRVIYEMDNDTLVCPFIDLRDYKVKILVLYQYNSLVETVEDFASVY